MNSTFIFNSKLTVQAKPSQVLNCTFCLKKSFRTVDIANNLFGMSGVILLFAKLCPTIYLLVVDIPITSELFFFPFIF